MSENQINAKGRKNTQNPEADSNPCYKEQSLSYQCLSKNNYQNDMCVIEFENYKTCKQFWNTIRIERMRSGTLPYVPPEEERQKIKESRFKGKREL